MRGGGVWIRLTNLGDPLVRLGNARSLEVQVGQHNGLRAQIISGLSQGDQVVSHPDDSGEEGERITAHQVTQPSLATTCAKGAIA